MKLQKLFVAVCAAAAALLFVACDSPEKVVHKYNEAINERDAETLGELMYFDKERREVKKALKQTNADWAQDRIDEVRGPKTSVNTRKTMEVIGVYENGSKAVVAVVYKKDGKEDGDLLFDRFTLEKDEGAWKICKSPEISK